VKQQLFQASVIVISLETLIAGRAPLVFSSSSVGAQSLGNQTSEALLCSPVVKQSMWRLQIGHVSRSG
jgi:hypothetical protein